MRIAKPNRATHTFRQKLCAPPARVFPLLCPVRETDWADGWLPDVVISSSGIAEGDCIFITPDKPGKAIWYVTHHEPQNWFIDVKDRAWSHGLSLGNSAYRKWGRMFCRRDLQPHQYRASRRRVRSQIHRRSLSEIHAGLGKAAQPFFKKWTSAATPLQPISSS